VEEITFERAVELLQIKRDKGPAPSRAKKTTAKTPAKRTTASRAKKTSS
jgi:DNA topoisomerase-1